MSIQWLGDGAVCFARPPGSSVASLLQYLKQQPGVLDVAISPEHVGLYFDPHRRPAGLEELAAACASLPLNASPGREHQIRVRYDGPDLEAVARVCGLGVAELISAHSQGEYEVANLGFLPGFAYLQGLDSRLILPRRTEPRPRIPAGSVAIGGPYTAIYPCASPGGWHLLGTALDCVLLGGEGALLQPGDRLRFVPSA